MKKAILIMMTAVAVFMLTACSGEKVVYETDSAAAGDKKGQWTVMVYMCGGDDETVNCDYTKKLEEIMSVNTSDEINVLIQTGGSEKWHIKGIYSDYCQRFKAQKGKLYLADQTVVSNMGDYRTLADFISWGTSNYKSDKYMLILSGAGGGTMHGVGYDELYENDSLELDEIAYAMSVAGAKLDMVAFDTSLMGSMEVAMEASMCADYMTAPQDVISNDEWDYSSVLEYLSDYPKMDAKELGKVICASYYKRCENKGREKDAAMSLVDLSGMSTLNQAFDGMAGDMLTSTDGFLNYTELANAISGVQVYGGATEDEGFSNSVDVGDMSVKIREYVGNTVDMFIEELNKTVIYRVCGERKECSTGLSVYYPLSENNDELSEYVKMANSSKYKEFLCKICTQCEVENANTENYTSSWAWSTYNNDIAAMEYKTIKDGDVYELNILGNMDLFKSIDINVYKSDKGSGEYVYIGKTAVPEVNWDGGIFKYTQNGKVLSLCGKNITSRLVGHYDGYDIYSTPVILNGERSNIRIKHNLEKDKYEIIGAWGGIDLENGRAYKGIRKVGFFDRITPILTVYDKEHQKNNYATGSHIVKMFGGVREKNLSNGNYVFEYELTDIYGLKRWGTPVDGILNSGKLTL